MADNDLIALAERCEAATGPDRELDATIGAALGFTGDEFAPYHPLYYTASLDAAMTLVLEGFTFSLWQDHRGNCAQVRKPTLLSRGVVVPVVAGPATPALALTAAALHARAAA